MNKECFGMKWTKSVKTLISREYIFSICSIKNATN